MSWNWLVNTVDGNIKKKKKTWQIYYHSVCLDRNSVFQENWIKKEVNSSQLGFLEASVRVLMQLFQGIFASTTAHWQKLHVKSDRRY